jgi:hypothetical protein
MRRSIVYISWLVALCVAGCTNAEGPNLNSANNSATEAPGEAKRLIDAIKPLMNASALPLGERSEDAANLEQWLSQYLKGEYRIVSRRLFAVEAKRMHWMSLVKFIGNELEQPFAACIEKQPWQSPGYDLAEVWRFPETPYKRVAVATLRSDDRASDPVVGVFELERVESARNEQSLQLEITPCPLPGSMPPR